MITVYVDVSGLNLKLQDTDKIIDKSLNTVGKRIRRNLIKNTPSNSELARASYTMEKSDNIVEIKNSQYYTPFVNDGTGVYGIYHRPITPKHAKVLVFKWKGKTWFLKSVKGQKPQKFVEKSINETKDVISDLVIKSVKEVI